MSIEEIRKGAPEGATHWDEFDKEYISFDNGCFSWWCVEDGDWWQMIADDDYLENLIPLHA